MGFLSRLFGRKPVPPIRLAPPIPPFEDIVGMMYDKDLTGFVDSVVQVIYSADKTKRFVLLRSERGFYTFDYQEICVFDEEEWQYVCRGENPLPAMWESRTTQVGLYDSLENMRKDICTTPEYRCYFEEKEDLPEDE